MATGGIALARTALSLRWVFVVIPCRIDLAIDGIVDVQLSGTQLNGRSNHVIRTVLLFVKLPRSVLLQAL